MIEAYELSAKLYHFLLKNTEHGTEAMKYLRSRGMSDKMIDQFQIGYAPDRWDTLVQFLTKRSFDLKEMEKGGLLSARNEQEGYLDRFADASCFRYMTAAARSLRLLAEYWGRSTEVPEFPGDTSI